MIGQYLSNNNEKATVPILQKNLHLNQPSIRTMDTSARSARLISWLKNIVGWFIMRENTVSTKQTSWKVQIISWMNKAERPKNFCVVPVTSNIWHMHEALNIGKKLHSLYVNIEMNLLNLVSPWLDKFYQIATKSVQEFFQKILDLTSPKKSALCLDSGDF
jgi:hypothetical protein